MKKLTLNQAWTLCLRQWKWIIEQLDAGSKERIKYLKQRWRWEQNEMTEDAIQCDCFFCEYDRQNNSEDVYCAACPGKLISPRFQCEDNKSYHWSDNPRKFYAKLLQLNEKRKAKK